MGERTRREFSRLRRLVAVGAIMTLFLTGCGITVPSDPDGSLDDIHRSGVLHAGASIDEPLVTAEGTELSGPMIELVEEYAKTLSARVQWTVGSEESLVSALERGEIDIAVGGMTRDTLWVDRVGVTRGYTDVPGANGRQIVVFVPSGENQLLTTLEQFLDQEVAP